MYHDLFSKFKIVNFLAHVIILPSWKYAMMTFISSVTSYSLSSVSCVMSSVLYIFILTLSFTFFLSVHLAASLSCVQLFCYFTIGVNYLQHRVVTGSFSCRTLQESCRRSSSQMCDVKASRNDHNYMYTLYVVFACILYSYILCFVLAGAVANFCDNTIRDTHTIQYVSATFVSGLSRELNELLNCAVLWLITLLYHKRQHKLVYWIRKHGMSFMALLNPLTAVICCPRKHKFYPWIR